MPLEERFNDGIYSRVTVGYKKSSQFNIGIDVKDKNATRGLNE